MRTRLPQWTQEQVAVLRAWQRHGATAARGRVQALYAALGTFPVAQQQRWRRRCKATLWGVALWLAANGVTLVMANTITVDGSCTLVDAITTANSDTNTGSCVQTGTVSAADTIVLTVDTTLTASAVDFYGPTGLPVVSSAITIAGNGHAITRDAGAPVFRLLAIDASGELTVQNTTLSGGRLTGPGRHGGAIFNLDGQLQLDACMVSGNSALSGGGLYSYASDNSVVQVANCTFSGNSAAFGGGMFSLTYNSSTFRVLNSTMSGNSASAHGGGVVSLTYDSSVVQVANSTVSGNSAGFLGGGLYDRTSDSSTFSMANSTVSSNSASAQGGGLVSVTFDTSLLGVLNSTVSGNSASCQGGGLLTVTSENSTFSMTNSTVSGNSASCQGGGVYSRISDSSTVSMQRSLIAGNAASGTGDEVKWENPGGSFLINAFNLFGHSGLTTAAALAGVSAGGLDLDILATSDGTNVALRAILDPTLANNGGPTLTHNLVTGSPTIDVRSCGLSDDQRGAPRPFNGDGVGGALCDIGAVEFGATPDPCARALPTRGCKVNNVRDQLCVGTSGNDVIFGTAGDDVIFGGEGNDKLKGGTGNDLLCGEGGNDQLFGSKGDDTLSGGVDADTLKGEAGNDTLGGDAGDDKLLGGPGDDDLSGGADVDTLKGNGGVDSCVGENESSCEL